MNATEKRIRIAELRGWTFPHGSVVTHESQLCRRPGGNWATQRDSVPDYLNSRDACAEFEAGLKGMEQFRYREQLYQVCGEAAARGDFHEGDDVHFCVITASAAQRCDAFLLLHGEKP